MLKPVAFYCCVLASTALSGCFVGDRMGSVVIKKQGALPCFAVEDTHMMRTGKPHIHHIYVNGKDKLKWSFDSIAKEGIAVTTETCIPYGLAHPLAKQTSPVIPLSLSTIYNVGMNIDVENRYNTLGWSAEFCMVKNAQGEIEALQIPWDESAGKWRYDLCSENK